MGPSEIGLESGPAKRTGQRRRWLARLGAAVYIAALLIAAGFVLGVGPPGEPGTIHVFGRDYQRYHPCCEAMAYFGNGPNGMRSVRTFMGMETSDPAIVHLQSFPLGWPGGMATSDATPATAPGEVFLQEGPDSYFPYLYISGTPSE